MLLCGDVMDMLDEIPDKSAICCVTSPPYYGLRDYGVEGQIGMEETPEEYVLKLCKVFQLLKCKLSKYGTLWLNIGDSYCSGGRDSYDQVSDSKNKSVAPTRPRAPKGCKPKDLIGIPWMLAFALRDHGWYLRSEIIWHKPNVKPESVTDRPTRAHEQVFLLSKSDEYYYDADAVKEKGLDEPGTHRGGSLVKAALEHKRDRLVSYHSHGGGIKSVLATGFRNKRSVWTIATRPYKGAHFATFPEDLPRTCILAGSTPGDIVIDPFCGSGTVGKVCKDLGRQFIGIDINPEYIKLAEERIGD